MTPAIRPARRPAQARRGITLVEMLVTLVVLLIVMTIIVQIFQSATGALSAAQAIQDLDNQLKLLDSTIRTDLGGVTARFTPPLDPAQNLGYFEYSENEFADTQGEDSDDTLRFTAKAPAGQPFTGRMWVRSTGGAAMINLTVQPVTLTSEYAEIIYFLRNGNLYRRVLLVNPELQSSIVQATNNTDVNGNAFYPAAFGGSPVNQTGQNVSWMAVNDLSARPAAEGNLGTPIVLNSLGDLTNRENRFASPRFADDFFSISAAGNVPDGFPDDLNADEVPDYYPTLYPGVFNPANPNITAPAVWQLIYEPPPAVVNNFFNAFQPLMAFPWVYPGAYSFPQQLPNVSDLAGWIHAPTPSANVPKSAVLGTAVAYDKTPLSYLQNLNHNPLDLGDSLPTPINPPAPNMLQTWWGFPTWRETLSPLWVDPTIQVNVGPNPAKVAPQQPFGLAPLSPADEVIKGTVAVDGTTLTTGGVRALLPAMTALWRNSPQLFTDGAGDANNNGTNSFFTANSALWSALSWEDDLIMTGVRSFDVKAYDNAYAGYVDLGWGDDLRLYVPYQLYAGYLYGKTVPAPPFLTQTLAQTLWPPITLTGNNPAGIFNTFLQTFAHEGRIPPLVEDNRLDSQYPNPTYVNPTTFAAQYPLFPNYSSNVGDDNKGVVRLRRVWDTWSTDYSRAPATGPNVNLSGAPSGPPFSPPIYPSYPPPYPAPLRGIQIQIRVADPTNQRIKSLTIRQDFTDKL
jgi:type II secretory pathway pseudopilin PulG